MKALSFFTRGSTLLVALSISALLVNACKPKTKVTISGSPRPRALSGTLVPQIVVSDGDAQSGIAGSLLETELVAAVANKDLYGIPGATVSWAVTGGGGTLSDCTTISDDDGLVHCKLTLGTVAGDNTVTASVAGITTPATFTATGVPGEATQLIFSQDPSNSVAGDTVSPSIKVVAKDIYDNVVLDYATDVTLSIATGFNPGGSTLSGATARTPSSGVATFSSLSLNKIGTGYKLTATAGALSVTSSAFDITPGTISLATSSLSVSSSSIAKGATSTLTLTAKDANSNLLTAGGSTVTFSRATTGGQGVGTITGTTDETNGTYTATYTATTKGTANTISAAVTGLGTVTSTSSITVTDTAPVASAITPAAFNEDTQSGTITLSYTDTDGDLATACTLSSLTNVTETQGCACDGSGVCTVKVTGTSNSNGAASFNYTVTAGGATSNAVAATLTINAVNDAPTISVISDTSTNEDVAKAVSFSVADVDNTLVCSSAYLSMSSSNTAVVANASVVWSGTAPNCTATITSAANAYGAATLTFTVDDGPLTANSAFVLTVNQLADDAFTSNWPFNFAGWTDASTGYTVSDSDKITVGTNPSNGGQEVAYLIPTDHTDDTNNSSGFAGTGSSLTGVAYGTLADGSSTGLKLDSASRELELSSNWTPQYSSIVGYWKMNGTVGAIADAASVTATVGSAGTTLNPNAAGMAFASGKINEGINLDGTDDYMTVPYTAALNLTTAWTISTWVNLSAHAGNTAIVTNLWPGAGNSIPFMLGWDAGSNISAAVYTGAAWSKAISSSDISFNTWQHVVGVYSGATTKLTIYRNGQQVGVNTGAPASVASNTNLIKIGRKWDNVAGAFITGKIDEVAIWNTALTAAEVATLYSRQSATYAGTFTSRVMDALSSSSWTTLSWVPTLPFMKELPDYASGAIQNETSTDYTSLVGSTGSTGANDLMTGIVGLWHLNETAATVGASNDFKDDSGQANNGEVTGTVTYGTAGPIGNTPSFNGTNAYASIADSAALSPTSALTVSIWAFQTSLSTNKALITKWAYATDGGWALQTGSGTNTAIKVWIADASNSTLSIFGATAAGTWSANAWHHVVFRYDGAGATNADRLKIYIDGVNQSLALSTIPTNLLDNAAELRIGDFPGLNYFWNGSLDEVAIWSRALHANEIKQLYQRGASRLKYQIKSCTASDCSDNTTWKGPDGTNQTYFSELNNNTTALDASGDVKKTLPSLTLSAFTSPPSNNRYFQYRTIFETVDSTIANGPEIKSATVGPVHYDAESPTIIGNQGVAFFDLNAYTESLGTGGCSSDIVYNLGLSKTGPWKYWTGAAWATSNGTATQANLVADINTNAATFGSTVGRGSVYFKAYLKSSGTSKCELNTLDVGGNL